MRKYYKIIWVSYFSETKIRELLGIAQEIKVEQKLLSSWFDSMLPPPSKRSSTFSIDSLLDKKSTKMFVTRRPCEPPSTAVSDSSTKTSASNLEEIQIHHGSPLKLSEGFSRCTILRTEDKRQVNIETISSLSPSKQTFRSTGAKTNFDPSKFQNLCKRRTPEPQNASSTKPHSPTAIFLSNHHHNPLILSQPCDHKIDSFPTKRPEQFLIGHKVEYADHGPDRQTLPRLPNSRHHPQGGFPSSYFNPHQVPPFHHIGGIVGPFVPHASCRPDVSYFTWLLSRHGSFLNTRIPNSGAVSDSHKICNK